MLRAVAWVTRRFRPRGADRLLRLISDPHRADFRAVVRYDERRLLLNVHGAHYPEWRAFFYGSWEPATAALIRKALRPGDTAIDVGANTGLHTLVMADAVGPGRVLAIEPDAANTPRIVDNARLNGFVNITVVEAAASDSEGEATLYAPSGAFGHAYSSLLVHEGNEWVLGDAKPRTVDALRLDTIVEREGLRGVTLVKIDAEGFEAAVLRGAHDLLARERPTLIFEYVKHYWDVTGATLEEVLHDLRQHGYSRIEALTRAGVEPLTDAFVSGNLIASAET
jgi:FkbM family methyltransferase